MKRAAPEALERSGSDENAPATSSALPSICAAIRCTAPMNAPRPPPIMPKRSLRFIEIEPRAKAAKDATDRPLRALRPWREAGWLLILLVELGVEDDRARG